MLFRFHKLLGKSSNISFYCFPPSASSSSSPSSWFALFLCICMYSYFFSIQTTHIHSPVDVSCSKTPARFHDNGPGTCQAHNTNSSEELNKPNIENGLRFFNLNVSIYESVWALEKKRRKLYLTGKKKNRRSKIITIITMITKNNTTNNGQKIKIDFFPLFVCSFFSYFRNFFSSGQYLSVFQSKTNIQFVFNLALLLLMLFSWLSTMFHYFWIEEKSKWHNNNHNSFACMRLHSI